MAAGNHHHAFGITHHHVARPYGCVAAADGPVDVDRLVQRQVGRCAGPLVVGRDVQSRNLGAVAKAAVGDHAGHAAFHQPGDEDAAGRRGACVLAAVDHEHRAGRAFLHRLALRVTSVVEHGDRVQVLARRHVAQREGRPHHVGQARVQRVHVLDELVAQATLEERGAQRGGAHAHQLLAGVRVHGGVHAVRSEGSVRRSRARTPGRRNSFPGSRSRSPGRPAGCGG
jgi:hypothetical protein